MIRASSLPFVSPRTAGVATGVAALAILGLTSLAYAGAPAQSPRPVLRPATQTAPPVRAADGSAVLNPWGSGRYERVWRAGDRIGRFDFHLLTAYRRYHLPQPPAGQAYVALGTQVLRVNTHDWKIVASVGTVNKILGLG